MNQVEVLRKRNELMVKLSWFSLALGLGSNLSFGSSLASVSVLLLAGGLGNLLMTVLIWKKRLVRTTPYIVIATLAVISSLIIDSAASITTYLLVYYTLALISLYQDWRLLTVAGFVEMALTAGYFFGYGADMFPSTEIDLLISLEMFVVLVTVVLVVQSRFAARVEQQSRSNWMQAVEAQAQTEDMVERFVQTAKQLREFHTQLVDNVTVTGRISREVTIGFGEVARGIEYQASSVHDILTSLQTVDDGVGAVNTAASTMRTVSTDTAQMTEQGHRQMEALSEGMDRLGVSMDGTVQMMEDLQQNTRLIGEIVEKVHGLSEQSSLLALNATIEAARAGESGRSFAVVANEVRKLAVNSQKSTEEIGAILERIRQSTEQMAGRIYGGQEIVSSNRQATGTVEEVFRQITQNTKSALDQATDVSGRVVRLQGSSQQMVDEVGAIAGITEESSASVEQILASIEEQDKRIEEIVRSFDTLERLIAELERS
jgi:methyl-accepting chemotaxis protein